MRRDQRFARTLLFSCLILGWLAGNPLRASAEGFFDLYGGVSLGERTSANATKFFPTTFPQPPPVSFTRSLSFDPSGTLGVRGGYWFEAVPWLGGAVDLSLFQRKAEGADIDLVPLSFLLMLRYPLIVSEEFPKGKIQPYVGVGPSFFYSHASYDFPQPLGHVTHGNFFSDIGLDVRAGTAWKASKRFALFLEYRFTHVTLDHLREQCVGLTCLGDNPEKITLHTVNSTLNTHHVLMGIRF